MASEVNTETTLVELLRQSRGSCDTFQPLQQDPEFCRACGNYEHRHLARRAADELGRLHQELEKAHQQNESMEALVEAKDADLAALQDRAVGYRDRAEKAEQELEKAQQERDEARAEVERLSVALSEKEREFYAALTSSPQETS